MKKKKIRLLAVVFCLLILVPIAASAAAYQTYTYSIDKEQLASPDAYTPNKQLDYVAMGMPEDFSAPSDLVSDTKGNIYIADSGNSCVYVYDSNYKFKFKLSTFINSHGINDRLNGCEGCFVTEDYVYVADTKHERIVIFDLDGNYVRHLEAPESDIFEENEFYTPIALAVDASGRIYVVSRSDYQGIMVLNNDGEFQGFVGAQQVAYSAWEALIRQFQSDEQRAASKDKVPTGYNNITIDSTGFIYCTSSTSDEQIRDLQQTSIVNAVADYSPIKKFNANGDDILGRNGFFGPGGEVKLNTNVDDAEVIGTSKLVDVALGPAGSWSIIDELRSRVYTYDQYGNLLFIFGDKGEMLGNIQKAKAIIYQGSNILILDTASKSVTLYIRTEYGDTLIHALQNEIDRNHDAAVKDYEDILQHNGNFDTAYIGIGKAMYRQGKYDEAMKMFRSAYETNNYSNAFAMKRQEWANRNFIWIPIVLVVVIFAAAKFFGYAAKVNKKAATSGGKRSFKEELLFGFHLLTHPFDGFWDLKHEKRGSVRGAVVYLILATLAFCYNDVGRAYVFNPRGSGTNVFATALGVIVPVLLWVVANWCLTSLFEGEGSMKDIFIATCYSLLPMILLMIPATALTNVLVASEETIYTLLITIAWVWTGIWLFFGIMVTHDYSMGKNVLISVCSIVGMIFIMFCVVLFSDLVVRMLDFISGIITELSY